MLKVHEGALVVDDGRQQIRIGLDAVAAALDTSGHGRHHIAATLLREQAGMPEPDRGERVSEAEIADVLRLDAAATPGPWHKLDDDTCIRHYERGGSFRVAEVTCFDRIQETIDLVVLLRTVGPRLAREVVTLREERDRAQAKLRTLAEHMRLLREIEAMAQEDGGETP